MPIAAPAVVFTMPVPASDEMLVVALSFFSRIPVLTLLVNDTLPMLIVVAAAFASITMPWPPRSLMALGWRAPAGVPPTARLIVPPVVLLISTSVLGTPPLVLMLLAIRPW